MTSYVFCQVLGETVVVVIVDEILRILLRISLSLALSLSLVIAEQVSILLDDPLVVLDGLTADEVFDVILETLLAPRAQSHLTVVLQRRHLTDLCGVVFGSRLGRLRNLFEDNFAHPRTLLRLSQLIQQFLIAGLFVFDFLAQLKCLLLIPVSLALQLFQLLLGLGPLQL